MPVRAFVSCDMLHLKAVATSILECVSSKNLCSNLQYIAAAKTQVAVFLLHSCKTGASGSGSTRVFVKSMMAVHPMGVDAVGGGGGGATTGEVIFSGTTIWITGAVAAVRRSVKCCGDTWEDNSAKPSAASE